MIRKITGAIGMEAAGDSWACSRCTYLNGETSCVCEMCGRARPREKFQWPCLRCTFLNEETSGSCELCGLVCPRVPSERLARKREALAADSLNACEKAMPHVYEKAKKKKKRKRVEASLTKKETKMRPSSSGNGSAVDSRAAFSEMRTEKKKTEKMLHGATAKRASSFGNGSAVDSRAAFPEMRTEKKKTEKTLHEATAKRASSFGNGSAVDSRAASPEMRASHPASALALAKRSCLTPSQFEMILEHAFLSRGGREAYEDRSVVSCLQSAEYRPDKKSVRKNFYGSVYPDFIEDLLFSGKHVDADFGLFVDLGSGIGQALMQTVLRSPRACALGVEVAPARHAKGMLLMSDIDRVLEAFGANFCVSDGRCMLRNASFAPLESALTTTLLRKPRSDAWPGDLPDEATLVDVIKRADVLFLNNAEGTMNERGDGRIELAVCRLARSMKVGAKLFAMDSLSQMFETNCWTPQADQLDGASCWMRESEIVVRGGVSWQRGEPRDHAVFMYTKMCDRWVCDACTLQNALVGEDGLPTLVCAFASEHAAFRDEKRRSRRRRNNGK